MALAMKSRAFKAGASAPRPAAHRTAHGVVKAALNSQEVTLADRLAPSLLAALVTLSGATAFDAVYAPVARADEEEIMSPYQKRQAELEKRREMLREAREKAAARAAGIAEPAAAPAPAAAEPAKPASDLASQAQRLKKDSLKAYESAAKNRPALPAPTAAEEEKTEPAKPAFGGFSFSKPEPAPAPAAPAPAASSTYSSPPDPWRSKPAPVIPSPAPKLAAPVVPAPAPAAPRPVVPVPVPVPVPAPAAKVETPKPAAIKKEEPKKAQPQQPKDRRSTTHGFLPLWLTELLVLGAYAAMGLAVTKYSKESEAALKVAGEKAKEAISAAEKLIGSKLNASA